jgi:hypothetical protein
LPSNSRHPRLDEPVSGMGANQSSTTSSIITSRTTTCGLA